MGYRVTVDGQSWLVDDLTVDEICDIEEEVGTSWLVISPMRSAKQAKAVMSRLMTHVGNPAQRPTLEQAKARVGCMTLTECLACITDDTPEPDAGAAEAPKENPDPNPESEISPQV